MNENPYYIDVDRLVPGQLLAGYRGARPETFTLGLRWSAADNLFTNAGLIAVEEWQRVTRQWTSRATSGSCASLCGRSRTGTTKSTLSVSAHAVRRAFGRPFAGGGSGWVSFAGFLGKRRCHHATMAGLERYSFAGYRGDWVPSGDRTTEAGFCWRFGNGMTGSWRWGPERRRPGLYASDAGKWNTVVYEFIREVAQLGSGCMWFATKGHGISQTRVGYTHSPTSDREAAFVVSTTTCAGRKPMVYLLHQDSDWWKSRVHSALAGGHGRVGEFEPVGTTSPTRRTFGPE